MANTAENQHEITQDLDSCYGTLTIHFCRNCKFITESHQKINNHLGRHVIRCPWCTFQSLSAKAFDQHKTSEHWQECANSEAGEHIKKGRASDFTCTNCNFVTSNSNILQIHKWLKQCDKPNTPKKQQPVVPGRKHTPDIQVLPCSITQHGNIPDAKIECMPLAEKELASHVTKVDEQDGKDEPEIGLKSKILESKLSSESTQLDKTACLIIIKDDGEEIIQEKVESIESQQGNQQGQQPTNSEHLLESAEVFQGQASPKPTKLLVDLTPRDKTKPNLIFQTEDPRVTKILKPPIKMEHYIDVEKIQSPIHVNSTHPQNDEVETDNTDPWQVGSINVTSSEKTLSRNSYTGLRPSAAALSHCSETMLELKYVTSPNATQQPDTNRRPIYCARCPFKEFSLRKLKCHSLVEHPDSAAVACYKSHRECQHLNDVAFFCVREMCRYSTELCTSYQAHLMKCYSEGERLTDVEKARLESTIKYILNYQLKFQVATENGFTNFVTFLLITDNLSTGKFLSSSHTNISSDGEQSCCTTPLPDLYSSSGRSHKSAEKSSSYDSGLIRESCTQENKAVTHSPICHLESKPSAFSSPFPKKDTSHTLKEGRQSYFLDNRARDLDSGQPSLLDRGARYQENGQSSLFGTEAGDLNSGQCSLFARENRNPETEHFNLVGRAARDPESLRLSHQPNPPQVIHKNHQPLLVAIPEEHVLIRSQYSPSIQGRAPRSDVADETSNKQQLYASQSDPYEAHCRTLQEQRYGTRADVSLDRLGEQRHEYSSDTSNISAFRQTSQSQMDGGTLSGQIKEYLPCPLVTISSKARDTDCQSQMPHLIPYEMAHVSKRPYFQNQENSVRSYKADSALEQTSGFSNKNYSSIPDAQPEQVAPAMRRQLSTTNSAIYNSRLMQQPGVHATISYSATSCMPVQYSSNDSMRQSLVPKVQSSGGYVQPSRVESNSGCNLSPSRRLNTAHKGLAPDAYRYDFQDHFVELACSNIPTSGKAGNRIQDGRLTSVNSGEITLQPDHIAVTPSVSSKSECAYQVPSGDIHVKSKQPPNSMGKYPISETSKRDASLTDHRATNQRGQNKNTLATISGKSLPVMLIPNVHRSEATGQMHRTNTKDRNHGNSTVSRQSPHLKPKQNYQDAWQSDAQNINSQVHRSEANGQMHRTNTKDRNQGNSTVTRQSPHLKPKQNYRDAWQSDAQNFNSQGLQASITEAPMTPQGLQPPIIKASVTPRGLQPSITQASLTPSAHISTDVGYTPARKIPNSLESVSLKIKEEPREEAEVDKTNKSNSNSRKKSVAVRTIGKMEIQNIEISPGVHQACDLRVENSGTQETVIVDKSSIISDNGHFLNSHPQAQVVKTVKKKSNTKREKKSNATTIQEQNKESCSEIAGQLLPNVHMASLDTEIEPCQQGTRIPIIKPGRNSKRKELNQNDHDTEEHIEVPIPVKKARAKKRGRVPNASLSATSLPALHVRPSGCQFPELEESSRSLQEAAGCVGCREMTSVTSEITVAESFVTTDVETRRPEVLETTVAGSLSATGVQTRKFEVISSLEDHPEQSVVMTTGESQSISTPLGSSSATSGQNFVEQAAQAEALQCQNAKDVPQKSKKKSVHFIKDSYREDIRGEEAEGSKKICLGTSQPGDLAQQQQNLTSTDDLDSGDCEKTTWGRYCKGQLQDEKNLSNKKAKGKLLKKNNKIDTKANSDRISSRYPLRKHKLVDYSFPAEEGNDQLE